jgi:hypothetical protein
VSEPKAYFALGTIYRDHAEYLREWIEFHLLVGVERFFLYNNGSGDNHLDVLVPYLDDGTVVLRDWLVFPGLVRAIDHCVKLHRDDARWIGFLDIDEFLFSPTGEPVSKLLREYEPWAGVAVNRVPFGTSGHVTKPDGLVIENYTRKAIHLRNNIKSIVDPTRVEFPWGAHHFAYPEGSFAVDENKEPVDPKVDVPGYPPNSAGAFTKSFSVSRLRINHYVSKSEQEFEAKMATQRPDTGQKRTLHLPDWALERLDQADDDTIQMYLPALKEAIARPRGLAKPPVASADSA